MCMQVPDYGLNYYEDVIMRKVANVINRIMGRKPDVVIYQPNPSGAGNIYASIEYPVECPDLLSTEWVTDPNKASRFYDEGSAIQAFRMSDNSLGPICYRDHSPNCAAILINDIQRVG